MIPTTIIIYFYGLTRFTVIILLAIGSQRYFRMNTTGYHSDFNEFRRELEESALKFIQEAHKAPQSIYEQWQSFSHAVNWQQSWIRAILGFHIAAFVCVLATRKNVTIQTVSFFLLLFIVGSLEYVNEYCSKHWQSFADQNYFDKHGVFVGVMVATPTLLIATFQLVYIFNIYLKFCNFFIPFRNR